MTDSDLTPEEIRNLCPGAIIPPVREANHRRLLDQINAHHNDAAANPNDPFIVHAVMYRNDQMGTLCNSGAWGAPDRATPVTDEVTCPACRSKIDGGPVRLPGTTATVEEAKHYAGRDVAAAYQTGVADGKRLAGEQLEKVRAFHDAWGDTVDADKVLDLQTLWEDLNRILNPIPDPLGDELRAAEQVQA